MMKEFKTYSAKPTEVERKWYLFDASEIALGRLSTQIATKLTGKGKPMFTSHIDCGDFVVVINGNLKEATLKQKQAKKSGEVIRLAVKGMLPKNKLVDERLKRLKIYAGEEHTHAPQNPQKVSLVK